MSTEKERAEWARLASEAARPDLTYAGRISANANVSAISHVAVPALLADVARLERENAELKEATRVALGIRATEAPQPAPARYCPRNEEWYTDPPLPCVCGEHS